MPKKYFFKSFYEFCYYSEDWYGCLDFAPNGHVLFYDDNQCFCIGYLDNETLYNRLLLTPSVVGYATEQDAINEVVALSVEADGVYFGTKLANRWLPPPSEDDNMSGDVLSVE